MPITITITGENLTTDDVVAVAREGAQIELAPDAQARIKKCRDFVEERIKAGEVMYGVNTGIGEFSEVRLEDDQIKDFQRYLITTTPPVSASPSRWRSCAPP